MFERLTGIILSHRRLVILLALVVSPLLIWHAFPPADNSFDVWLDNSDPTYRSYLDFLDQFESEEFLTLVFRSEDVFTLENLQTVQRLAGRLKNMDDVERVTSLTDVEEIRTSTDGTVEINPLIGDEIPSDPGLLKGIRERALSNPLYVENLISPDGTTTAIYGVVNNRDLAARRRIQEEVESLVREEESRTGNKIYISGSPILDAEFERTSQQDNVTFTIVTSAMIVVVLYILYRSLTGILLPVLVVSLATGWTLGIYGLTGHKLNMMTIMLPAVILAISIADAVHFMCQYNDEHLHGSGGRREALIQTLSKVGLPCLFTSLTTAIGFGSFAISRVIPVRYQGIFTALGIMLAFLLTITLLPALLSYLKPPRIKHRLKERGDWISKGLEKSLRVVDRYPRVILGIGLVVLAVSVLGMSKLKRETNSIEFFKKSSDIRVALEFIEENLTGVFSLEVILEGPPDSVKEPEVLRKVEELRSYLNTQPEVTKTLHLNDLIMEMNRAMNNGEKRFYAVPSSKSEVAQYLLLYEMSGGETLDTLVNADYSRMRLSIRSLSMTAERARGLIENLDRILKKTFNGPVQARFTGVIPIWVQLDTYLLQSQIRSFTLASIGIFIMMCILLRSIRVGLLSMIPNLFPIVVTMGIMGWSGIRLDTATIMITSVALGIAVDDTIHFLARFKRELAISRDYDEAIHATIRSVGRAIVFTSIILFWGFISLTLGHFKPTIYFGFLTGLTMMVALIGDIFLLPVLLKIFKPIPVG